MDIIQKVGDFFDALGSFFTDTQGLVQNLIKGLFNVKFKMLAYEVSIDNIAGSVRQMVDFTNLRTSLNGNISLYSIVSNVNSIMVSIGLSLLTLFFMINMVQKALEIERLTWEKTIMECIRFFVYKFLIQNSLNLLETFLNITNNLMTTIANSLGINASAITVGEALAEGVQEGFFPALMSLIVALVLLIVIISTTIGVLVPIFSLMMKVVVCLSVAPIPMSVGISDFGKGRTTSFVMSVVGLGIEACLVIIITKIYLLTLVNSEGLGDGIGKMVGSGLRIIFANSLYAALLNWSSQKVQSMLGGS